MTLALSLTALLSNAHADYIELDGSGIAGESCDVQLAIYDGHDNEITWVGGAEIDGGTTERVQLPEGVLTHMGDNDSALLLSVYECHHASDTLDKIKIRRNTGNNKTWEIKKFYRSDSGDTGYFEDNITGRHYGDLDLWSLKGRTARIDVSHQASAQTGSSLYPTTIHSNRTDVVDQVTFCDLCDGRDIAFDTWHESYLSARRSTEDYILLQREWIKSWETFEVECDGDDAAFRTHHGTYLSAASADEVDNWATDVGDDELWSTSWEKSYQGFGFESSYGTWLRAWDEDDGSGVDLAPHLKSFESYAIVIE